MSEKNKAKILRGTRDFSPEQMKKRLHVISALRSVFQLYNFDTIETPAIEFASTILGKLGEEGNKLSYTFENLGGDLIALRYDQTVPFARYVAMNYNELPLPFKRYQIGPVWRADRPGKGRYREFVQCDIDIIGTKSLMAECEITKVVYTSLTKLGLKDFRIKMNSRRLINSLLTSIGVEKELLNSVIRIIDKQDKIGLEKVLSEVGNIIGEKKAKDLKKYLSISGSNSEKVQALQEFNTDEISDYLDLCKNANIPDAVLDFDVSLARGLDYYTGIIFEVFINDIDLGAVCSGGRYDDLCSQFCSEKLSGVGVAFGLDRILIGMEELGEFKNIQEENSVLVVYFCKDSLQYSQSICSQLQEAGIRSEHYFEEVKLGKQIKYADKKNMNYVVIAGVDESKKNEVSIKNIKNGEQETVSREEMINVLSR